MPTDYRWTDVSDENEIDRVSDPRIIHMNCSLRILENHSAEIGTAGFADMVFPLDFDATYTIGSNISCDFFLPTMNKDTMKVHVKNYEVFVSESYLIPIVGSLLPQIVIPGGLIELKENMKIRCGSFTLVYTTENTSWISSTDGISGKTVAYIFQSSLLLNILLGYKFLVRILTLDPSFGSMFNFEIETILRLVFPHDIVSMHILISRLVRLGLASFADWMRNFCSFETTELFNYFRCRLCRAINKFTDVRLGDFIHSSLVNLLKLMNDVSKHDIMCSSCRNTRIFINPEDFYECRTCLLTLCSLCSLSNFHRTHDIISLTLRGTARLCKMFKTIYATEREIEALLSRKKEFDKNHLTTKKSILRTCHLKLKSSSVGLRSWIPLFEEDMLRLESVLVKCAHIYNEEMEKRCDDMIEKSSKQLYENSKVYDETWKQLDGKLDAVLELVDVRLPVLLAGKEVNLKY